MAEASNCRIVISRNDFGDTKRREFEEKLANECSAHGLKTLVTPNLYHLPPDAPCLSVLRKIEEPILLFSWLQPRAAFWTLRMIGVKGSRCRVGFTPPHFYMASEDERPIVCLNMADRCCPGRWLDAVGELLGGRLPTGRAAIERVEKAHEERWYPVVDYDRCKNCQQCMEFCLFGVYDADGDGRITVAQPDACKPGCPACSRVCPNQAIMFPLYESDPAIAGCDRGKVKSFGAGSALLKKLKKKYKEGKLSIEEVIRACSCEAKAKDASSCSSETSSGPGKKDNDRGYFDRLINGLIKE